MNRSDFLRNSFLITGGLVIAPSFLAAETKKKQKKITILHTNDTHSNIEPFPANHPKYAGKGGVEQRFQLIEQIRQEEEHVILLDAGDIFQGTPYFNMFGGVLEMKVMTALGYDAATMGNHDFDGGMEGFKNAQEHADFPFLCANYDFSDTILQSKTQPSLILEKGGIKIGILGIGVKLEGLVPADKYGTTRYLDPIDCANKEAEILKRKGCELIICLSHLGYSYQDDRVSDILLARKSKNIHLIIGGHTHTFLEKPTEEVNADGKTILINQVGFGGIQLGRLDFLITQEKFSTKESLIVQ